MTERPNNQPEFVRWETEGVLGRMKTMLAEAGQSDDADKDVLLQYAGVFNQMLGADNPSQTPVSVIFETGPDIHRNDGHGEKVDDDEGQVRYGVINRCVVYEDADSSTTKLHVQIKLHDNDRTDFSYDGAYYYELASFDESLSISDVRLHEVERPTVGSGSNGRRLARPDQAVADRLVENACLVDEWRQEYLDANDDPVSIETLLKSISDRAQELPGDQASSYVDEQVAAFNMLVNSGDDDSLLMAARCRGVVEKQTDGSYESRYVDELEMVVYAMDVVWVDSQLSGHLYCLDIKGNIVRCRLNDRSVSVELFDDSWIDAGYEDSDDDHY